MKRIIRIIFVASVLVLAAVSAAAETYAVKKGDSLFKIGKRYGLTWQALAKANSDKVKNPNWIFPGQVLIIPEIAKTAEGYTPIKSLGRRPFGKKRDIAKAIKMLSLSEEVKQLLIAKVKSGEFKWAALKKGDKREQMIFGNYRVQDRVVMDFPEGHLEAVRRYSVEWQGQIFHLEIPLKCDNPSWWSEQIPLPPITPPPPVEPEPVPPPPPVVEPEKPKPKPLLLMMIPPPEEEFEAPAEIPLPLPTVVKEKWRLDADISVGAFADWHKSGNNPHGMWGVGSFYEYNLTDGDRLHSFGFALEGNYWHGVTGDDFHYFGSRYAVDGAYRLLTPGTEFQLRAGLGEVNEWGYVRTDNPAGKFRSSQTSEILTAYAGYEIKRNGQTRWFNRLRYYGQADFDIDRDKSDRWIDVSGKKWRVDGEAGKKTNLNFGVDGSVYKLTETVSLALGISTTHYQADNRTGLRLSPGIDFYASNMLVSGARVNPTYWSDNDHANGISAFIDLTNLIRHLFPRLMSRKVFGQEEWKSEKPDQKKQEQIIQDIL